MHTEALILGRPRSAAGRTGIPVGRMTVTLEKPIKRRGPISEEHRSALREAALKRHDVAPTPSVLPAVLLRLELVAARRAGFAFEEAWPDAVESAVADTGRSRRGWGEVLEETRPAWERAYLRDQGQPCWNLLEHARI